MTLAKGFTAGLLVALATTSAHAQPAARPDLTAAEIVEKNAVARGGVEAWRKMQTMAWTGHVEGANGRQSSFLLEQKRPNQTRFEIIAQGQKSIRAYDGTEGWKLLPASSGRPELASYSDDELRFARGAQVIEGPLMDYAARAAAISLQGVGEVEGRNAYLLQIKTPSGGNDRVWVDAQTFLETRHDREARSATGQAVSVTVFFRDYRSFEGLQLPVVIETGSGPGAMTNKLVIERVALNPALDDKTFAKPLVPVARRTGVTVDTRSAGASATPGQAPRQ